MECQYSSLVDPSTYDSMGLCECLPLRVSKFAHLADKGALRAQADWKKFVGRVENFTGCISPRFNGIAVAVAECIPERLEVVTYANEFAFLHDDILDTSSREKGDAENDEMANGFQAVLDGGDYTKISRTGKSQMQAKLVLELLSMDRERALVLLKSWEGLVKGESGTQHLGFQTLDEYLPHRVINLGQSFWFGIITFAMALTISEEEEKLSREVTRPAYVTLALTNDFFSWKKEYDDFIQNPSSDNMANAVWIIMQEYSVGIEKAKDICREKIIASCREYQQRKQEFEKQHTGSVSPDLLKYLSALEFSISGNVVWSQYTPRYNFNAPVRENHALESEPSELTDGSDQEARHVEEEMFHECSDISTAPTSDAGSNYALETEEKLKDNSSPIRNLKTPKPSKSIQDFSANHPERTKSKRAEPTPVNDTHRVAKTSALDLNLPELSDKTTLAPYDYISSLPSKGVRDAAIDALNVWHNVPAKTLTMIKSVISLLHSSSLMLDDIEDGSPLRRGHPSTHTVFGIPQTINSANYLFVKSLNIIRQMNDPRCLDIYIEELGYLHIGQGWDLFWTNNVQCPTVQDYMTMVDYKTGGLFRMLSRLMAAVQWKERIPDVGSFVTLIGRYFQIRDDYQNLMSADYTNQKGFCEDLDEGKYSLPLIHALNAEPSNMILRSILQQR